MATKTSSSQILHEGAALSATLDKSKPLADYTALRAYAGSATQVRITSNGIAGFFYYDTGDTSSVDNGGTVIVSSNGKRWKRVFDSAVNVKWFGAKGDWNGTTGTDDTVAIQAALNCLPTMTYSEPVQAYINGGGEIFAPRGSYLVTDTLFYSGAIKFSGEAMLSTYIRFRPSAPKPLFKGSASKYSRGTTWNFQTSLLAAIFSLRRTHKPLLISRVYIIGS